MKFKLAVPSNVLNADQIEQIERALAAGLLEIVGRHFPNWAGRAYDRDIAGGEIILQNTDLTRPINGLKKGVHLTISLVSFSADRNFDGLAKDTIDLIKNVYDEEDSNHPDFMVGIAIFVQMSLDRPVRHDPDGIGDEPDGLPVRYIASPDGKNLLEFSG